MKNPLVKFLHRAHPDERRGTGLDSADEIVKLAQVHLSEDFPNPSRINCPTEEKLSQLIHSRRLPEKEMRAHLVSCSECFRFYRAEMAASRQLNLITVPVPQKKIFLFSRQRVLPALAGAVLVAMSATLVSVWIYSRRSNTGNPPTIASATPPTYTNSPPSTSRETTPANVGTLPVENEREPSRSQLKNVIAQNKVQIDLEAHSLLRGAQRTQGEPSILTASKTKFEIKLPSGSPSGTYKVMLADPFGNPVRSTDGIKEGSLLRVHLNLSSIRPGRYMICVTTQDEVPDCLPTVIKNP